MQKTKGTVFDPIAETYYELTPPVSEKYIQLIRETFKIKPSDHIIDLGCGSGDIALSLAQYSSHVAGIDLSKPMIDMAKEKDLQKQVRWMHKSVDAIDLGEAQYNLIISFESFHLFPNPVELIQRCARALQPGGALCIGWRMFAFDVPLRAALEETFAAHGIPYEWGYWSCPAFPEMVANAHTQLSPPQQQQIDVPARMATKTIVEYVFNISNTATMDEQEKHIMARDLEKRVAEIYPSGECVGYDQYVISYCKK